MTEDRLREELRRAGFTRLNSFGEVYQRGNRAVTIGANEIVAVDHGDPRVARRFHRAKGGLLLALEWVQELD
jgi:hypothetical protein